jgi:hypothetical protein
MLFPGEVRVPLILEKGGAGFIWLVEGIKGSGGGCKDGWPEESLIPF